MTTIIKQNDCGYDIVQHTFKSRRPLFLEGASARFVMGSQDYKKLLINADAYILSSSETEATLEYKFTQQDTLYPGRFIGMFIVTWKDGKQKTFPSGSSIPVEIQRTLDLGVATQYEERQALKVSLIDERFEEMKVDIEAFKKNIEALGQNISSLNEQQRAELDQRMGTAEEKVAAVEEEQSLQEKRIDNIMAESGNDSVSAAEIRDAHLGADGVARPNLGSMMREMHKQQIDANAQTTQLKRGLNLVQSDQSSPISFEVQGQTRVNLLGDQGYIKSPFPIANNRTSKTMFFFQGSGISNMERSVSGDGLSVGKTTVSGSLVIDSENFKLKQGKKYMIGFNLDGSTQTSTSLTLYNEIHVGDTRKNYQGLAGKKTLRLLFDGSFDVNSIRLGNTGDNNMNTLAFGKVCVFALTDAEYTEALTLTDAQLAEKYPYIDGVQHVRNPVVTKKGKNLIAPFSGLTSDGPYYGEVSSTGSYNSFRLIVPVIAGEKYTLTAKLSVDGSQNNPRRITFATRWRATENGADINSSNLDLTMADVSNGTGLATRTTVAPVGVNFCVIYYWRATDYVGGSLKVEDIMFNQGEYTPFTPQNNDHLYFPDTLLGSSLDGTVRDSIYKKDSKYVVRERMKKVLLDGSLDWENNVAYSNDSSRQVMVRNSPAITEGTTSTGTLNVIAQAKSGELFQPILSGMSKAFQIVVRRDGVFISFPDSITGWNQTTSPTKQQIKDFFQANPVALSFEIATPVERKLNVEGEIGFHSGANLVELGEGLIVREKGNPVIGTTSYQLNNRAMPATNLKRPAEAILAIYRDGQIDNKWNIISTGDTNGKMRAHIPIADFDPKATYTVTYVPLDKHTLTTAVTKATATYNTNHKTVQDTLVQGQTDMKAQLNVQAIQILEVFARLRAGGI